MGRSLTVLGVCKRDVKFRELLDEYANLHELHVSRRNRGENLPEPGGSRYALLRHYFYYTHPSQLSDDYHARLRQEFLDDVEDCNSEKSPTCSVECPPEGYFYCGLGNTEFVEEDVGDDETPALLVEHLQVPEGFPIPEKIIAYYL